MKAREKLIEKGVDNLSYLELLALLIGTGDSKRGVKRVASDAERLINRLRDGEREISYSDIREIEGIGTAKASRIISGIELGRRLYDKGYKNRMKITTTRHAVDLFKDISSKKQEYLEAAYINARYEIIAKETLAIGTLDQVGLHPRDVISKALTHNSYGVIIAHNHPSGDPTPSKADTDATKRLNDACELMGIKLVDHIVLCEEEWRRVDF